MRLKSFLTTCRFARRFGISSSFGLCRCVGNLLPSVASCKNSEDFCFTPSTVHYWRCFVPGFACAILLIENAFAPCALLSTRSYLHPAEILLPLSLFVFRVFANYCDTAFSFDTFAFIANFFY